MRNQLPYGIVLALLGLGRIVAQALPPPATGGVVEIEVTADSESQFQQHDYQPAKPYTVLAETIGQSVWQRTLRTFTPGAAGSVKSTFIFDTAFADQHPEIVRPTRGVEIAGINSEYRYRRIDLETNWDGNGQSTFVLTAAAESGPATYAIRGRGEGSILGGGEGAPAAMPRPTFHVDDVTEVEGKVAWFTWSSALRYRHLHGINNYWTEKQPDGSVAVFHTNYYHEVSPGLGAFPPIGAIVRTGTPGQGPRVAFVTEPLGVDAAYGRLRDATWTFTDNFQPTVDAVAHYAFSPEVASASKLRYKLQIQPGLARTIMWSETFTPEGASEPSDRRFLTEIVTAEATETQTYIIDPFARLGQQPGQYRVVAFESDSFDVTLTADTNGDNALLPAGGPITGHVIANADTVSAAQPYRLLANTDDDDGDAVTDASDEVVNGADDLADFFPVFLNIRSLLQSLPPGDATHYRLSQANGALNFVYTDLTQATAFSFREDTRDYGYGPSFEQPVAMATAQQITAEGVELSVDFLDRIRSQNQGVILIEARAMSSEPLVLTVETGTGTAIVILPLQAIGISLAVDADRDGKIKLADEDASDATSADQPFRFWINDDDDDGDDKRSSADDIPLPEGNSDRDSSNSIVDGIRDMEDFFPVFIDIKALLTVLPPGTNDITYYLTQEDDSVGVVFTRYTRTEAFDYLRGDPADLDTGFGPALTQKAGEATVTRITAAGVDISTASPAFFSRIQNNDGGVLLIEASKATTKPLVLEVREGSEVIATVKLELKVDLVETMFRYYNLRSYSHGTAIASNNQGPGYSTGESTPAPNDPFQNAANRKSIVFVHGYNVNSEAARGSASTVFKRFYWSGSKAKFYAVLWRGDDGQGAGIAPAGTTPDYHRNVGHAWQQGPYLRDFLLGLQGDTAIMAHSLGNMVAQVALTHELDPDNPARLRPASHPSVVKNYFAIDAALPLEAVDGSAITSASKDRMRASSWNGYDERLWSTHWHELFTSNDARSTFTWQNVFAGLDVGTNFYSSGEEVLADPEDDGTPFWEPLFFRGLRAWVAQEKIKGGNSVSAVFFRSKTAGWTFNTVWYKETFPPDPAFPPRLRTPIEARDDAYPAGVPTSELPEEPFFKRFQASETDGFYPGYQGSRLMAPLGDANADDEASKLVTIAKCLGEAIPALSYAQGSNPSSAYNRSGMGGNFDLNEPYDPNTGLGFKNGWPASRASQRWFHSDCLDVAYIFHFKFYDRMKSNGALQ